MLKLNMLHHSTVSRIKRAFFFLTCVYVCTAGETASVWMKASPESSLLHLPAISGSKSPFLSSLSLASSRLQRVSFPDPLRHLTHILITAFKHIRNTQMLQIT